MKAPRKGTWRPQLINMRLKRNRQNKRLDVNGEAILSPRVVAVGNSFCLIFCGLGYLKLRVGTGPQPRHLFAKSGKVRVTLFLAPDKPAGEEVRGGNGLQKLEMASRGNSFDTKHPLKGTLISEFTCHLNHPFLGGG